MHKKLVSIESLTPDSANANLGTERGRGMLEQSLRECGAGRSILVDSQGVVLAGNKTLLVAEELGLPIRVVTTNGGELVVVQREDLDLNDGDRARRLAYFDNRTSAVNLDFDVAQIVADMESGVDLGGMWTDGEIAELVADALEGQEQENVQELRQTLAEQFVVPPFSVLDARRGYWQERKRAWLALGIRSELGRGNAITWGNAPSDIGTGNHSDMDYTDNAKQVRGRTLGAIPPNQATRLSPDYGKRGLARCFGQDLMRGENPKFATQAQRERGAAFKSQSRLAALQKTGKAGASLGAMPTNIEYIPGYYYKKQAGMTDDEIWREHQTAQGLTGTSIFDPVLCEIAYRWFCPPKGKVLDPFAGGSVRGIVAAHLGREYVGVELRAEQVEANREQAKTMGMTPRWVVGDSRNVGKLASGEYDLLFTCPPYYDLEVYSDLPGELSTAPTYDEFLTGYRQIIASSIGLLKEDRFACIVVGDVRDKRGNYRNFVSDTIAAFRDAGCELYNEAILVTALGSLPIRVGKQFKAGRKLGKTHQNVLVFVKGDGRKAADACGAVEVVFPGVETADA